MNFKVFKMNDYDTVISHFSKQKTNEWYIKEFGYDSEEQPINEVDEIDAENGFWSECGVEETAKIIEKLKENEEIKFKRIGGCLWVWTTFKELIETLNESNYNEPFVVCSTEC